mgnify:CR=1 FL=1
MENAQTKPTLGNVIGPLVDQAFDHHGSSCLWNMPFPTSMTGAAAVAKALKKNGGMDAWRLAVRLEEALAHAS